MKEIVPGLWDIDEIGNVVHCFLWQWQDGVTLIDTGMPGNTEKILAAVRQLGYQPADVKRIIITHGDVDHMGSARELKRATRAPIACHTVESELLQHPNRRKPINSLLGMILRPVYAAANLFPGLRAEPVKPDQLLVEGETTPEGFLVIHTPGHTPGHISLLEQEKRVLIVGDAMNNRGGQLHRPPVLFTPDPVNAIKSIQKLGGKYAGDFDVAVFGHGPAITGEAGQRIRAFADQLSAADR
jgi:glyoxylase-like metal-dependent hydrolase (beta-lactamase superfamily II)